MVLALSSEMQQGLAVLLMALCAVTITLTILRRRQFQTVSARDLVREQLARLRDQKEIRVSLEELLLQLEETSRRVNAQLDTKFARLEAAIRDADARIAKLSSEPTERPVRRRSTATASPPQDTPPRQDGPPATAAPRPKDSAPTLARRVPARPATPDDGASAGPKSFVDGLPSVDPGDEQVIRSASRATPPRAPEQPAPPPDESPDEPLTNHHRRVYDLFDAGVAPIRIAEQLGVSLGEVELILNLRGFR